MIICFWSKNTISIFEKGGKFRRKLILSIAPDPTLNNIQVKKYLIISIVLYCMQPLTFNSYWCQWLNYIIFALCQNASLTFWFIVPDYLGKVEDFYKNSNKYICQICFKWDKFCLNIKWHNLVNQNMKQLRIKFLHPIPVGWVLK